jgi:hypothetical protein
MKSLARHLYTICSINPSAWGVICTVTCVALTVGMLRVGPWAREIVRRGLARF